jgi:hypothetical protein
MYLYFWFPRHSEALRKGYLFLSNRNLVRQSFEDSITSCGTVPRWGNISGSEKATASSRENPFPFRRPNTVFCFTPKAAKTIFFTNQESGTSTINTGII